MRVGGGNNTSTTTTPLSGGLGGAYNRDDLVPALEGDGLIVPRIEQGGATFNVSVTARATVPLAAQAIGIDVLAASGTVADGISSSGQLLEVGASSFLASTHSPPSRLKYTQSGLYTPYGTPSLTIADALQASLQLRKGASCTLPAPPPPSLPLPSSLTYPSPQLSIVSDSLIEGISPGVIGGCLAARAAERATHRMAVASARLIRINRLATARQGDNARAAARAKLMDPVGAFSRGRPAVLSLTDVLEVGRLRKGLGS